MQKMTMQSADNQILGDVKLRLVKFLKKTGRLQLPVKIVPCNGFKFMVPLNLSVMSQKYRLLKDKVTTNALLSVIWVSENDLITHFNICKRTLGIWHEEEGLPKYQIGRLVFYKESEVIEWIEKHRIIPQSKKTKSSK